MAEAVAIRTENLTKHFDAVRAITNLSIDVPTGTIFGFLGPNGSGKTTTIRLLLGLLEPTFGSASVLGYDARAEGEHIRAHAGALLEHPGIYERLTAEDNLEFYARAWKIPAGERRERIKELLTSFDLWDRRGQDAGQWSRGMKQKLAVARAMLHRPRLIFLDEPTAGFDPIAAASFGTELAALAEREGTTVFLTSHNLVEVEKLCGRVAVIRRGELVAYGSPGEIRAEAGGRYLKIVGTGMTQRTLDVVRCFPRVLAADLFEDHLRIDMDDVSRVAPLVRMLIESGVEVEEIRKGTVSLEAAFLGLMQDDAAPSPGEDR
ncbi:MAG TPA: ABC transporter ATP-binding protein [Thermomicrobiales bacterium]|nr:ABC transporter ATP-binding protein [Thermomicrobiales bacterium]